MTVIGVPGFGFDPGRELGSPHNPETRLFPLWRRMLQRELIGHGWYSVPSGLAQVREAWRKGYRNRYTYAWRLAEQEGQVLRRRVLDAREPVYFVCHSLGTRVALAAVEYGCPGLAGVVMLNGAEHLAQARQVAAAWPEIEFLNVVVRNDGVLRWLGSLFSPEIGWRRTIGRNGLGREAPPNWLDLVLDDPDWQEWGAARGWTLRGNNRRRLSDHWFSYEWRGNWPLYRAFLDGSLIF